MEKVSWTGEWQSLMGDIGMSLYWKEKVNWTGKWQSLMGEVGKSQSYPMNNWAERH